MKKND